MKNNESSWTPMAKQLLSNWSVSSKILISKIFSEQKRHLKSSFLLNFRGELVDLRHRFQTAEEENLLLKYVNKVYTVKKKWGDFPDTFGLC